MNTTPARDPVCGMAVNPLEPPATVQHAQVVYYFCSAACKRLFEESPETYTTATGDMPPLPKTNQ